MRSYCLLNCQELWLPTGDLCKIGPVFIFILKWAPGRAEWEERERKGAGRVSWGVSLQDIFFSGVAALSCPCSCKHPLTFVYLQAARGWPSFFGVPPVPSLGKEYILWESGKVHTAVSFFLLRKRQLCGEDTFRFVRCLFWTTLLFLSLGYHQSG